MTKNLDSLTSYDHQNHNAKFWRRKRLKEKVKTSHKGRVILSFLKSKNREMTY